MDRRRLITMSPGGRPILDLDLEITATYVAIKDTFAYAPGAANTLTSREPGRFGGEQTAGENNGNGQVTWQAWVRGSTIDQVAQNVEALLVSGARTSRSRLLEWRPDGATRSSYFRIAGPIGWTPTYSWSQMAGGGGMDVNIVVPVRPLVLWDRPRIVDPFDVDSTADYTFDALTAADVVVDTSFTRLVSTNANLTSERRARHTARGYTFLEGQATVGGMPSITFTGYKLGVLLRASAPTTYVEAYVDDNGTNSRLRIDVVIAGTRTNRASTNLGARVDATVVHWVRARIQGQVVTAEYFTTPVNDLSKAPPQSVAPTTTNTYTLISGEQASLPAGYSGWSWIPQNQFANLSNFEFRPFTQTASSPAKLSYLDSIPGTAPALADITVIAPATAPIWALFAWTAHRGGPLGVFDPSGVSAAAANLTGWSLISDASGLGGSIAKATTSGAGTYVAEFVSTTDGRGLATLPDLQPDDFSEGRCDLEIWARVSLNAGLVNPRLAVSLRPINATAYGEEFTEMGSTGRLLTKPSSGTVRRFTRVGVISVPADSLDHFGGVIRATGTVDAGSTGEFGLDYLYVVPARRRAACMTAIANDSSYPTFMIAGAKTTRSDLSGIMQGPATTDKPGDIHGLGGNLIIVDPGPTDLHVKLSNLVPDDPTSDTTDESVSTAVTVAVDVTPRSFMLRGA